MTPAPSVRCSYCQATNLLGSELTTQRALSETFKGPTQAFYASAATVAVSIFVLSSAAGVVAVLVL